MANDGYYYHLLENNIQNKENELHHLLDHEDFGANTYNYYRSPGIGNMCHNYIYAWPYQTVVPPNTYYQVPNMCHNSIYAWPYQTVVPPNSCYQVPNIEPKENIDDLNETFEETCSITSKNPNTHFNEFKYLSSKKTAAPVRGKGCFNKRYPIKAFSMDQCKQEMELESADFSSLKLTPLQDIVTEIDLFAVDMQNSFDLFQYLHRELTEINNVHISSSIMGAMEFDKFYRVIGSNLKRHFDFLSGEALEELDWVTAIVEHLISLCDSYNISFKDVLEKGLAEFTDAVNDFVEMDFSDRELGIEITENEYKNDDKRNKIMLVLIAPKLVNMMDTTRSLTNHVWAIKVLIKKKFDVIENDKENKTDN